MEIINMTPHTVNIYDDNLNLIKTYESMGQIRCAVTQEFIGMLDDIPVMISRFGEIENLPDYKQGTIYIVSRVVAEAMAKINRDDCVVPNEAVRDVDGRIVGCKSFAVI